ncbi:hypothetical protein BJN34_09895 [Cupriavidus necator]|uniref:Uncharacterized protein n=1 Tax=Cupriavidus necator TaxID=106590 RepID=A0A1U9UNH2_CUPNE|nr:hypothetical protein [Cupriavidus necator]AQV94198.1 hypothetical protein BJN34_09895 [Cupriavidus necator]
MIDALASDVAVTWLGAVGCGLYLHFLWSRREAGAGTGLFLFGVLTALLAVRGFSWLFGGTLLAQLVFAAATLLPIAMTLFAEYLVRRHHPLWLKLLALGVSVAFFAINVFTDLSRDTPLLLAFLGCFAVVTASNGWFLLWLRDAELSDNEERLARAVVLVVALAVPLAATDFREELRHVPVRLGALGALAFVYVFVNLSESQRVVRGLLVHIVVALLFAILLASVMALASRGPGPGFAEAGLRGMPVAIAWVLLTAIFVRIRAVSLAGDGNAFLRWLLHARLDTPEGFLHSLRRLPQTADHVVLGNAELAGYALDALFDMAGKRREPVSIGEARAWAKIREGDRVEAAEQLVDLLERHEMTHALLIARQPAQVVLLNLPQGANAAIGELRAAVILRLARHLGQREAACR